VGPGGLSLLLERGAARLVVTPRDVAGARVEACEVAVDGQPRAVAACRGRVGAVTRLKVSLAREVVQGWLARRLVGAWVGGWRVGQVRWDRVDGTGLGAWTLTGMGGAEAVWLRIELAWRADGGRLRVGPRRCWLLGPPGLAAARTWTALMRRLGATGVRVVDGALEIDAARATIGPAFAAAGWRVPGPAGTAAVRGTADGVEVWAGTEEVGWPEGQDAGWSEGQVEDPLAEIRGWLHGSADRRVQASERLQALAAERPALAVPLARARAAALRFVDRAGCVAALRDWLAAGPEAEAWWMLAVQSREDGLAEALTGLAELAADEAVRGQRVLARAQALGRVAGGVAEARTLLEPRVIGGETPVEVWRTLARLRAADPSVRAADIEEALAAALGEDGWRHRGDAGDLRGAVAEAVMRSGRPEASMAALLRRILGGPRRRGEPAGRGETAVAGLRRSTQIVADYYAQDGRWRELVALLERELGRLGEAARAEATARIARIRRLYLDGARSEAAGSC
jgi:hypothetical protein